MSNAKTAAGAMLWMAIPLLMALVALEPVQLHHAAPAQASQHASAGAV